MRISRARRRCAAPCVRDLHVGIDGGTEGCDGRARERGQSDRCVDRVSRTRCIRSCAAVFQHRFRCFGRGDLRDADLRRDARVADRSVAGGCRDVLGAVRGAADQYRRFARAVFWPARPEWASGGPDRRTLRGDRRRSGRCVGARCMVCRGRPSAAPFQHVRADGNHGQRDGARGSGATRRCECHWASNCEYAGLCAGCVAASGADRCGGGVVYRWRAGGEGVFEPAGADAGAVHRRSVRGGWAAV
ncbi:Uncharacterised protein [Burkholderia pseudomallei]|nr:Uncharacterised protein [Burkholderia pseudomallei]